MPYTPPSQQSPATSKPTSPAISRSSSYHEDGPWSQPIGRPAPPRSHSSTSYLHRHRRTPSVTTSDGAPPTPTEAINGHSAAKDFAPSESVRQSPPPVNDWKMPTGAVISPPDSSENSDGDETGPNQQRGRDLERNWDELKQAVMLIDQKREGSPDRSHGEAQKESASEPVSQIVSPTGLSAEARKIAHSRSSTETAIVIPRAKFDSPRETSDESDEDENYLSKPSLVRKKSGELVKPALRPSSRRRYSSMPGTPTYSKSVHFNDSDNQTRHFLQVDKPIAVSAGTSPVETYDSENEFPFEDTKPERQINLANFPSETFERRSQPVVVERIFLSSDKQTLIGVIAVQNISFHKLVVARFTLDYWKTTSEVVAEFNNDTLNPTVDGRDRFNVHIKLSDQANIDNKTLLLCVRYNVGGQEFWDNNSDRNYQIDFSKVAKKRPSTSPGLGARPLHSIPRSKHSPPTSSRGQRDSLDDDFATRFDGGSTYSFGSADQLLGGESTVVKLKKPAGRVFMNGNTAPTTNGLGGRYNFGASLSAALTSAQDKLGRQSGLMNNIQKPSGGSYFGPIDRTEGPVKAEERPDALTTDRPAMGSDQYRDLVQKFCYFTSSPGKPTASTTQSTDAASSEPGASTVSSDVIPPSATTDGADDSNDADSESSSSDSEPSSPLVDGCSEQKSSTSQSPFASRAGSPTPITGGGMGGRAASPISFGFPFINSSRDGYLSDSQSAPTAIVG